ncbi:MAG: sn-glycerol-1-phosphate dehydrogenase [Ruminococcaceae bacterium]|nr:sn-glycerol-1-phosphate dehydrogenase [Oscillospiraceae bacterium]
MKNFLANPICSCGKIHNVAIDDVIIGNGVISRLPELINRYGCTSPFILADVNTYHAAGKLVCKILDDASIPYNKYVFPKNSLKPNEEAIGSAVMHFDKHCDLIIGIGSGVINDIGKILSNITGKKYIIVCTAPSMDGYASGTSSMDMDGLKTSLNSRCADVIIGDIDILKRAPEHMLRAGLGDMLAKYISITEWRIANVITGEYYCEQVAQLIRTALKKCVDNAEGLMRREDEAIKSVFEGLVIGGIAMAYAGVSRPASGVEHYFSHVWDMRGLEFGTNVDLHGIQCAMGTLKAAQLYEILATMKPDTEKAKVYVEKFDYKQWCEELCKFLGTGAKTMIAQEKREQKYDSSTHPARLERIIQNWDTILKIIREEIPAVKELRKILDTIGISSDLNTIGVNRENAKMTFRTTKDIRDKYVLSRLAWDLGVLDELAEQL